MAEFEFYTDWADEAIAELDDVLLKPLATAMARGLRQEIVDTMDPGPPRSGRTYTVPGTKTTYTASAPGEPPAIREGLYREAWGVVEAVATKDVVRALVTNDRRVGSNGEYLLALLLEEGTSDLVNFRVQMEPRPHIRPGMDSYRPKARVLLRRFSGR